jgi:hypothetical protein
MELDDHMKELVQHLGSAINDSLSASEPVSDAFAEIREAGYDVFLILEATIGLHRRDGEPSDTDAVEPLVPGDLLLTPQDAQFLKSLKITLN